MQQTDSQTDSHLSPDRVGRVTGSNVGAILGCDPNKTAKDVMRAMVRRYHGEPTEFQGNIATEWGRLHEALAGMDFLCATGVLIEDCGFFIHPEHDWLGATPDGLIQDDGIAEIKCPFGIRNDPAPQFKTAQEQPHYYAQMQVEMACTGRVWAAFYQWTPKGDIVEEVLVDEGWWKENLPKLKAFHDQFLIELDNPAHLDPLRKSVESDGAECLIAEYDKLTAQIDDATARKKEILNELVEIAEGKNAEFGGRKLTRVERVGSVNYKNIPELKGLDLNQYRGAGTSYWRLS